MLICIHLRTISIKTKFLENIRVFIDSVRFHIIAIIIYVASSEK